MQQITLAPLAVTPHDFQYVFSRHPARTSCRDTNHVLVAEINITRLPLWEKGGARYFHGAKKGKDPCLSCEYRERHSPVLGNQPNE